MLAGPASAEQRVIDPHRFALMADTHISEKRAESVRGIRMDENLQAVGQELLALPTLPAAALIDGDCAYLTGKPADYAVLVELLKPLRMAGLPIHLALGNHDDREEFWKALPNADGKPAGEAPPRPVVDKHVTVVESPRANWFLIDTLNQVNVTPGMLGEKQLGWLAKSLDAMGNKPAIVVGHHHPDLAEKTNGLRDTAGLMEVLRPRRQVQAYIFGHTHNWSYRNDDGLHLINLPPVAYVFDKARPSGWVDAQIGENGMTLELHSRDKEHPEHARPLKLAWRT